MGKIKEVYRHPEYYPTDTACEDGYKYAIKKSAEWLNNNAGKYVTMVDGQMHFDIHRMVTDFKRDMEE